MTDQPARYRNKTAEITAVQWTGDNAELLRAFCGPFDFETIEPEDRVEDPDATAAMRESAHGTWVGLIPGDWAVRCGDEFDRVAADDFADLYEPVTAVEQPPADRAALERIRALHQPTEGLGFDCDEDDTPGSYGHIAQVCGTCGKADEYGVRWPCATVRVIDEELRRLADEAQPDDTVHACPGRWGGPDCRCFDAEAQPARAPIADQPCDGFPEKCPNLRTVPIVPPHQHGGIRCGCGDQPAVPPA